MARQKRRGRPTKKKSERLDINLTFRISSELKRRISSAARESGRTLSGEINSRLQRSLETSQPGAMQTLNIEAARKMFRSMITEERQKVVAQAIAEMRRQLQRDRQLRS